MSGDLCFWPHACPHPTSSHGDTLSPDAALARMKQFWAKQSTSRNLASLTMQLVALADQEAQRSSPAAKEREAPRLTVRFDGPRDDVAVTWALADRNRKFR